MEHIALAPVAWTDYEPTDDGRALRIVSVGLAYDLGHVEVEESADAVTVKLWEEHFVSIGEDVASGVSLMPVGRFVLVPLSAPLNGRRVLDGVGGEERPRVDVGDRIFKTLDDGGGRL